MKSLLLVFAISLAATASQACISTYQKLICPGDQVVSGNGYVGTVKGINLSTREAEANWTTTPDGYQHDATSTHGLESLALGRGCLNNYCVNDKVVSGNGFVGKIIGVNPYTSSVAVHWSIDPNGYATDKRSTLKLETVSIGHGCVDGFCVGDKVFSGNDFSGIVIGVNPSTKSVGVHWRVDPKGDTTDKRSTHDIKTLSTAEFCEEYGDSVRSGIQIQIQSKYSYGRKVEGFTVDFILDK